MDKIDHESPTAIPVLFWVQRADFRPAAFDEYQHHPYTGFT
jgi:hypothetical protein